MSKFRKLQELGGRERMELVKALLLLPVTAVALELIGLNRWQGVMARAGIKAGDSKPSAPQIAQAKRAARVVTIAARYGVHRANCLQQSLVLQWLLKQRNIKSEIRYGARREETEFSAHAWIECEGVVLNDTSDVGTRYTPFQNPLIGRSLP